MKLKSLYLFLFLLLVGTSLMAQEKYEQAVVTQGSNTKGYVLYISIEGKELKEVQLDKSKKKHEMDNIAILNEIAQMRNDGWEVWSTSEQTNRFGITYMLRRKLK